MISKPTTSHPPRRAPLHDAELAIQILEEDGGVILTGFSSVADVEAVNADAAPYLAAVMKKAKAKPRIPPHSRPAQN